MWRRAKNPLQVRIADNSIMSYNEVMEGLSIELGGVQCILLVLWATDQPSHDLHIDYESNNIYNQWSLSSY